MILRINSKFRLPAAALFLCDKPRKAAAACLLALGACTAQVAEFPAVFEAPGFGPADIDLDDYELSFEEQFDGRLDVSDWRCDTKWIAHTPWAGDYGGAAFANPRRRFPFLVKDGLLRIEAKKDSRGEWRAGMLSAGNSCGEGFSQQYGYFEMRANLPRGKGLWPAFWLIGRDYKETNYTAEIDVIEHHGHKPDSFASTIHVHPSDDSVRRVRRGEGVSAPNDILYNYFNTFGVDIDRDFTVIYFNRQEVWRTETPEEFNQPFFPLVTLALDSDFPIDETPNPSHMYVDYVRVYQKKETSASRQGGTPMN
jgi:beta-glucanase (GH16 family)